MSKKEFLNILLKRLNLFDDDANSISEVKTEDEEEEFAKQLNLTFLHGKTTELNDLIKIIRKIKTKDW